MAFWLCQVGWWGALIMTLFDTLGYLPRAAGVLIVMFIGIAIAAGQARSRMRLTDVIVGVFQVGIGTGSQRVPPRDDAAVPEKEPV
jgi:hypothetical protein